MSDFVKAAKKLVKIGGDKAAVAARYLSIRNREKVLRFHSRKLTQHHRATNPLHQVGFKGPMSVVGCDSRIIVRAEGMALKGIPFAMDLDSKGRDKGDHIEEVTEKLERRGYDNDPILTLSIYADYVKSDASILEAAHKLAHRRIPHFEARIAIQKRVIEKELCRAKVPKGADVMARFTVIVGRDQLAGELTNLPYTVLSYDGTAIPNARLKVGKSSIPAPFAMGKGNAVVSTEALYRIIAASKKALTIECDANKWRAWADSSPGMEGKSVQFEFSYFGMP